MGLTQARKVTSHRLSLQTPSIYTSINHMKIDANADLDYNNTREDIVLTCIEWEPAKCNSSLTIQKIRSLTLDSKPQRSSGFQDSWHFSIEHLYQWFLTFAEWLKSRPGTDWPQHMCLVPLLYRNRELFPLSRLYHLEKVHPPFWTKGKSTTKCFLSHILTILFSIFSGT